MVNHSKIFISVFLSSLISAHGAMAATYYLPEYTDKWNNFSGGDTPLFSQKNDSENNCFKAGYKITVCPAGSAANITERCPYSIDKDYYKKCYTYAELCKKDGFTLTCPAGSEPDLGNTCKLDSIYTKCQCAGCMGYDYSEAAAKAAGYLPDGPPCLSCSENKYKRKINPCTGYKYDSSNCGIGSCGSLAGDTCQSGEIIKYKECKPCPVPACPTDKVNYDSYWCGSALKCWWPG